MTKEKNQRLLHLVLKRKWWDDIESLVKPEEYRDILFWCVRLIELLTDRGYKLNEIKQ